MIKLQLIAPDGMHFDGDVYEAVIPTKAGDIAVYEGHAPLLSVASPGLVAIRKDRKVQDDEREFVAIFGGTIEVLDNVIRVLVDEVETSSSINEAEAEKAHQRALELKEKAKDAVSLEQAQMMIDRANVRLKLASIRKHKRKH